MKAPGIQRAKGVVRGAVQGVGFRPFVYRLATELGLAGWVKNSSQGVFIEVEGERGAFDQFMRRFEKSKPPRAILQSVEFSILDAVGCDGFEIRKSDDRGAKTVACVSEPCAGSQANHRRAGWRGLGDVSGGGAGGRPFARRGAVVGGSRAAV